MNPEEQTVTWLISLGVLSSPKKNIADPEEFLKASLKDGVVLCKLTERLVPDFTPKGFEPEWLYTGENFGKVLTTLLAFNFATQGAVKKNLITYLALKRKWRGPSPNGLLELVIGEETML